MVYVSNKTLAQIDRIHRRLRKIADGPGRIVKADIMGIAIEEYAAKLNQR